MCIRCEARRRILVNRERVERTLRGRSWIAYVKRAEWQGMTRDLCAYYARRSYIAK